MAEPGLRIAGLGAAGLSLEAGRGEVVAVLGAPGSGKTELLQRLAGRARATGEITLNGQAMAARRLRAAAGYVRADFPLPENATVLGAVAASLRGRRLGRARLAALAEAALELAEVGGTGRRVKALGAAERQRAAWACATVAAPPLLLLDEPLGAQLPEQLPGALWALHRLVRGTGATTVIATRIGQAGLALADQGVVLEAGRVVQAGTPDALYERAASRAAAVLTGAANLLPGHVLAVEDGMARVRLRCGPVVSGELRGGLRPRDECVLCVRPERVAVAAASAAELGEGALDAVVADRLVLGDRVLLRLLIGSGAALEAVRPVGAGLRGLAVGAAVAVAWQEAHAGVMA